MPDPLTTSSAGAAADVELVHALSSEQGDLALAELIRRHAARSLQTARRVVGDFHLAEEAVQDAFMRLALKAKLFRGQSEGEFRTFFYRMLLNCCIRAGQKAGRRREHAAGSAVIKNIAASTRIVDVTRGLREEEARRQVRWALDRLPDRQRICLILREMDGQSYKEIATVLQVNLNDVRVWIHRGRKRLKTILENGPDGESIRDDEEDASAPAGAPGAGGSDRTRRTGGSSGASGPNDPGRTGGTGGASGEGALGRGGT
ncbi:MAG: RNA polymerase sigma factor [Planctomycetota bacterium]